MRHHKLLLTLLTPAPSTQLPGIKNLALVHRPWADASDWHPVSTCVPAQ